MTDSSFIKRLARSVGFDLVGVCRAVEPPGLSRFYQWLEMDYAGDMNYLPERREAYRHPHSILEGVRSVVMLGLKYAAPNDDAGRDHRQLTSGSSDSALGTVSRYARSGLDYHDVVHQMLKSMKSELRSEWPDQEFRGVVDTAPLLERDFARLAGLGWQGKNTMLISKTDGSWFFLAAMLTDLELTTDAPLETTHCGTCTACLDACPTDAFPAPFVLDASRCISYFTIESRSLAAEPFRGQIGDWLFGCDICQEVCPWNRKPAAYLRPDASEHSTALATPGEWEQFSAATLFSMDEAEFRRQFRKTPFWRTRRSGMLRNLAIVLGNRRDPRTLEALEIGVKDADPLVRAAVYWAIGQIDSPQAIQLLQKLEPIETDPSARQELVRLRTKRKRS